MEGQTLAKPVSVGIAGLGTVGTGVLKVIERNGEVLAKRAGRPLEIIAVSARSRSKDRGVDISHLQWEDDAVELARRPDIDVFVELIGGEDGPAKAAVAAAIESGKDVVTANKAMLAVHGQQLAEAIEKKGQALKFEAAVAGGIPVVKALSESLAANRINCLMGILNGTCNYILTRMESTGLSYEEIFREANELGYLEADPTLDVGGYDASHKLALLASIAFGSQVDIRNVEQEGIERISIEDIEQARDMGYRVKLLCVARQSEQGLEQRTQPCLVPANSPLGQIQNATNIVVIEGDASGPIYLRGAGAGEGPTASAVIGDIIDIARGNRTSTFGQPATSLKVTKPSPSQAPVPYYIRLLLKDRPGALAKIAGALGDAGVSINRMRQYGHDDLEAPVIIVTHGTTRRKLNRALSGICSTGVAIQDPVAIRIEEFHAH